MLVELAIGHFKQMYDWKGFFFSFLCSNPPKINWRWGVYDTGSRRVVGSSAGYCVLLHARLPCVHLTTALLAAHCLPAMLGSGTPCAPVAYQFRSYIKWRSFSPTHCRWELDNPFFIPAALPFGERSALSVQLLRHWIDYKQILQTIWRSYYMLYML